MNSLEGQIQDNKGMISYNSKVDKINFDGSYFKNFENKTVATSAIPRGMPGCPELAFSIASIERALMALDIFFKSFILDILI